MADVKTFNIEVVYALPEWAHIIRMQIERGTTIKEAIMDSGIMQRCPEIDLEKNKVGVFGSLKDLDTEINEGDRIEIYRGIRVDPKEARRKRAGNRPD